MPEYKASIKMKTPGRIVIPIDMRRALDIKDNDPLDITADEDTGRIVIEKKSMLCCICGSEQDLKTIENSEKYICANCIKKITNQKEEK